jgi:hypothetical protein
MKLPNSNGLLTNQLFRVSPFTDSEVKVVWAPTSFTTYNCQFIRPRWSVGFGTFASEYRPPTNWPVANTIVRRPRVVLFDFLWKNFWVDDPLVSEARTDKWRERYTEVVAAFAGDDRIKILKGPSFMETTSTYLGGYEGNDQVEWIGADGGGGLNGVLQRDLRWIEWILPSSEDVADGFVGLDVLHVVFGKQMGLAEDYYNNQFPDEYAEDIAAWIASHDKFVNHAAHIYLDSQGALTGETLGAEDLAVDAALYSQVASDLGDYGVIYKGQDTLTSSATIIQNINQHFDLD